MQPNGNAALTLASQTNQLQQYLSQDSLEKLRSIMTPLQYKTGTRLFWEGEPAQKLFYILKGQVKVTKTTDEGREMILYILQDGDFFGEMGGFNDAEFSFSGEAMKNTEAGIIDILDLEQLISMNGEFAVQFIKWMGVLQRTTESKFRDLLLFGKNGALASTIIRLCNSYGKMTENGIELQIKLNNTDFSNMIGTTRESVNRLLKEYKDAGAISMLHSQITVHDLQYFRDLVHCPNCPEEICRI
ncbi:Crp/Fnr family transcriptional regulator [Marinicrinis lubricantis]|uniref:Crp/Fnr family transcriptional regulator n=1 Tax=Marinicrinis lubricantis TaxID=2086470 RepID=A0ABW1IUD0_9BACL